MNQLTSRIKQIQSAIIAADSRFIGSHSFLKKNWLWARFSFCYAFNRKTKANHLGNAHIFPVRCCSQLALFLFEFNNFFFVSLCAKQYVDNRILKLKLVIKQHWCALFIGNNRSRTENIVWLVIFLCCSFGLFTWKSINFQLFQSILQLAFLRQSMSSYDFSRHLNKMFDENTFQANNNGKKWNIEVKDIACLPVAALHRWFSLTKSRFFNLCLRSSRYFEWAPESHSPVPRSLSMEFCEAQHRNSFDLLAANAARVGEKSAFVRLCRRLRFLRFSGCDPVVVSLSKYSSGCEAKQLGQFIKRIFYQTANSQILFQQFSTRLSFCYLFYSFALFFLSIVSSVAAFR